MDFFQNAYLSLTVGIAAIIGWVRFRKTDPAFTPFILLLTVGFVTELVSILLITYGYSNAIPYNLYVLTEALLLLWLFYNWGLFPSRKWIFHSLYPVLVLTWACEWLMRWSSTAFLSYYIIVAAVCIVLLSIHQLSILFYHEPEPLYKHPIFLICLALLVYFTYTILVEVFWIYGLNGSSSFRIQIYQLFAYINLFANLLFILATLWIPMKSDYILRS